jgi:hypothetical protein
VFDRLLQVLAALSQLRVRRVYCQVLDCVHIRLSGTWRLTTAKRQESKEFWHFFNESNTGLTLLIHTEYFWRFI